MPESRFNQIRAVAIFAFAPGSEWDKDRHTWDIFIPVVEGFNDSRARIFKRAIRVVLDESMSGWRPKTSKRGGLPNITFLVRKPVPLGTEFKNSAGGASGCLLYLEVQEGKHAGAKKYKQHLGATAARTARAADGVGLKKGDIVYGDSWFGSVKTAWYLKSEFEVDSTFVVKTAHKVFPKRRLTSLLAGKPRGSHRVLTAEIKGVKMLAVGYKYNTTSTIYFISTCGVTTAGEPHIAKWATEGGVVRQASVFRPGLCAEYYKYCTKIDDHNHLRQSSLALERHWKTQGCWFRLLCTICGMCATDLFLATKFAGRLPSRVCNADAGGERLKTYVQHLCKRLLVPKFNVSKRSKRKAHVADGLHHPEQYKNARSSPRKPVPVNRNRPELGVRIPRDELHCKVCKMKTDNICTHCRGAGNCTGAACRRGMRDPCCWQLHIDNEYTGLLNSGMGGGAYVELD